MLDRDPLASVSVVEAELVGAVVADRDRHVPQVHHLDLMGMAAVGVVGVVTPMHSGQRGPNDRVGAVRCHTPLSARHPRSLESRCIRTTATV